MLAYNVGPYIGAAIEGVLRQRFDAPLELVIGEDCSTDDTRAVCERYQAQHPGIVRLLPAAENLGIAGNAARTLPQCRGKYVAICDGDDIWTDPDKLRKQVGFLEAQPEYGLSYSDVHQIGPDGAPFVDPAFEPLDYAEGQVFLRLLQGNFINNSTAVFRRALIADFAIDTDRSYYIHDFFMWLHVSLRGLVHFLPEKTTAYRRHPGGVTNSEEKTRRNRLKFQQALLHFLPEFDRLNTRPLTQTERELVFRKTLSLLYRGAGNLKQKIRLALLALKYFPGFSGRHPTPPQAAPTTETATHQI